jgi:hypothetical protein
VAAGSDRFYVTVFADPGRRRAMAVVFNEKQGAKGLTAPLTIAPRVAGIEAARAEDLETGEPLVDLERRKPGLQTLLYVPPRDFRIILLMP